MFKLLATITVVLAIYAQGVPAAYCSGRSFGYSFDWTCTFSCCYDFSQCCYNYWYAWTIVSLFFLLCLCACGGFGGYRYRRRYYYTQTARAPVTTTVVTTANTAAYQPAPPQGAYQPYAPPKDAPPPYNPAAGEKPPSYY